jgi:hypothetical protein
MEREKSETKSLKELEFEDLLIFYAQAIKKEAYSDSFFSGMGNWISSVKHCPDIVTRKAQIKQFEMGIRWSAVKDVFRELRSAWTKSVDDSSKNEIAFKLRSLHRRALFDSIGFRRCSIGCHGRA